MRTFKDFYKQDLDKVLFNTNEKAIKRRVNGTEITIIVDDDKLSELKQKSQAQYADGIYNASLLIFVRASELGYRPANGSDMEVEDRTYQVIEVSGDELLQIVLETSR